MNQPTRLRISAILLVAALVTAACEKKKPPAPLQAVVPTEFDAAPPPAPTSQTILQKTFVVKTSSTFPFEIPPHIVRPHLHGIFASFLRDVHVAGDNSANVDLVIFNAEEYEDFTANRPSETLFSVEATHNQSVNLDLPASFNQPVKYYLIFRNSTGKPPAKTVEANFRLDF